MDITSLMYVLFLMGVRYIIASLSDSDGNS